MKTLMTVLLVAAAVPASIVAQEVNIVEASGRMWTGAKVTKIDATGITFHTALGGNRPFFLRLDQLSKADQARYKGRVEEARAAEVAKQRQAQDAEKARRAAVLAGTITVPTAKGDVEGVTAYKLESSGVVVAFDTFIGEKRVAVSDLTPEWQTKAKEAAGKGVVKVKSP